MHCRDLVHRAILGLTSTILAYGM